MTLYCMCISQASHFWSHDKTSPLLYFPCDQLCNEAKSSMQFSSENHSFVSDPKEPEVLFGRASRYKQSQGRMVCCPRVADFYKATLMVNKKTGMQYIAALGVSQLCMLYYSPVYNILHEGIICRWTGLQREGLRTICKYTIHSHHVKNCKPSV